MNNKLRARTAETTGRLVQFEGNVGNDPNDPFFGDGKKVACEQDRPRVLLTCFELFFTK